MAEELAQEERETGDGENEQSLPHKLNRQQEVAIWERERESL